jgi:hypothetical protein
VIAAPREDTDAKMAEHRSERSTTQAPNYGWFTEGFDTLDLKQAKVLLDELYG